MEPAVRVEGIGKRYRIREQGPAYATLRDAIMDAMRGRRRAAREDVFWALKDVSFEVASGEAVGIVGRNGAGKSTLLKILSRITAPTEGRAIVNGRVGSLLEVGTGFHPELTGAENIRLSGAILGMERAEVMRKFDEIVAFAELERFLELPVKRYSSGMYMRLAFSVAAHLEPDILIVDEVLAVGDAAFQKKCLGKMHDAASGGRTVLFVSHNMPALARLCDRGVLLQAGRVSTVGPIEHVLDAYSRGAAGEVGVRRFADTGPSPTGARLVEVAVEDEKGSVTALASTDAPLRIRVRFRIDAPTSARCALVLATHGTPAFTTVEPVEQPYGTGTYESVVEIPAHLLTEGEYLVNVSLVRSRGVKERLAFSSEAVSFVVFDPMTGSTARGDYAEALAGVVRPRLTWRTGGRLE